MPVRRLSRRASCAAAAAAAASMCSMPASALSLPASALSPLDALRNSQKFIAQRELKRLALEEQAALDQQTIAFNSNDMDLEEQLYELLTEPLSSPTAKVDAILTQLESNRGRQQRAGYGQSAERYDLPYIGAWSLLYASDPTGYVGGGPQRLELVSARQWIYGPGSGGAAAECVYALPGGPVAGSLLVTRMGNVTKLPQAALRLEFEELSRGYQLSYTMSETRRLTTKPRVMPAVGALLSEGPQRVVCAPSAGLAQTTLQTTYLSDVLWILRGASGSATVLKRTEAEALQPQNGDGPDGFDARRFGPSGRRMWMFDTGYDRGTAAVRQQ